VLVRRVDPRKILVGALVRPSILLVRSPVLLCLALYSALVSGANYVLFTTYDTVFEGQYGFPKSVSGLVYLGLGAALLLCVVFFSVLEPRIQAARMKADGVQQP
jgi:predicted MFS family arabinose efflux permease